MQLSETVVSGAMGAMGGIAFGVQINEGVLPKVILTNLIVAIAARILMNIECISREKANRILRTSVYGSITIMILIPIVTMIFFSTFLAYRTAFYNERPPLFYPS